jgi:nitrite reductase/ring-hydroxylating ferredoxin subunit
MEALEWIDVGDAAELARVPLQQVTVAGRPVALSHRDGVFAAISGACNHVGGPLGHGSLEGEYVVCPWHGWKFHRDTGHGEPGFEADRVPRYEVRVVDGRVQVSARPTSARHKAPHPKHRLERSTERAPGRVRVLGISTTNMDLVRPATRPRRTCSRPRSRTPPPRDARPSASTCGSCRWRTTCATCSAASTCTMRRASCAIARSPRPRRC